MFEPGAVLPWLLAWMSQMLILGSAGALLLVILRVRHPRTQLAYCHALLAICVLLPMVQPRRHPEIVVAPATPATETKAELSPGAIAASIPALTRSTSPLASAPALPSQSPAPLSLPWPRILLWTLGAGVVARLCWLLAGLWRIRKYRIGSMPLYPILEPVQAAAALTHVDAVFCISPDTPGPVMLGWLTPVILLPESFLALAEEAQCGVACHELLHVQRHDWLITLLEELIGALLWFNPATWLLLAQTRLAREQLVDAEVVRLTAAREPYIDALLTIARGGRVLDLAPAPLFLRKRHLTQRMHLLLLDATASPLRLISSYASIAAVLALTGWLSLDAFPLIGSPRSREQAAIVSQVRMAPSQAAPAVLAQAKQRPPIAPAIVTTIPTQPPSAAVPFDPREPVTGAIHLASTPEERASALALFERAFQNGQLRAPAAQPWKFTASFAAAGNANDVGSGELSETWFSGRSWRWTLKLGNSSLVRYSVGGQSAEEARVGSIPMRAQMLWDVIHWAGSSRSTAQIRTAPAVFNGRAATCLLFSGQDSAVLQVQARLWEEDEYCIDNSSGLLLVRSVAPGIFAGFHYGKGQVHSRTEPDRITIYVAGEMVADASLSFSEATSADQASIAPPAGLIPIAIDVTAPARIRLNASNPLGSALVQPVMVHAEIDGSGRVLEEEIMAAADPALARAALDLVKATAFAHTPSAQQQIYVNVRFNPPSQ